MLMSQTRSVLQRSRPLKGNESYSSSSTDNVFVLFPAGAPSVRRDVTGRSGVKCRTVLPEGAAVAAGRRADIQLTEPGTQMFVWFGAYTCLLLFLVCTDGTSEGSSELSACCEISHDHQSVYLH